MRGLYSIVVLLFSANCAMSQGVYIPHGIYVSARGGSIQFRNNLVNNGTFTHTAGLITFCGDTQVIRGTATATFNDLTIAGGSKTTIATNNALRGVLLCNGTVYAGGKLTLLSTTSQTALIDGSGAGEVMGTVTMQRFLTSIFGYKYISSPFQLALVEQLADDIDLSSQFPLLYKYAENRTSSGWIKFMNTDSVLQPFKGYAANIGSIAVPGTIDMQGVVNNGTQTLDIYNNNQPFTKGFNLLGNPYPSPIDWDIAAGWVRTNIDDAVYYFNAGGADRYKGTYSSYINGISSDGNANSIIPAMQGFFVHVSTGSFPVAGSITINNQARINDLSPFYHKTPFEETRPLLRLEAGYGGNEKRSDPVVIYFDDKATDNFDKNLDALKMMNTDALVPNLYALSSNQRLSINALPYRPDSMSIIPLGLAVETAGQITFDTVNIERLPYGVRPYLMDVSTGIIQDIILQPRYSVSLPQGIYENRFCLVFSARHPEHNPFFSDVFDAYGIKGDLHVILYLKSGGQGEIIVTSMTGQQMLKQPVNGFGLHVFDTNWNTGVYIVSFVSREGIFSKKVVIPNE